MTAVPLDAFVAAALAASAADRRALFAEHRRLFRRGVRAEPAPCSYPWSVPSRSPGSRRPSAPSAIDPAFWHLVRIALLRR